MRERKLQTCTAGGHQGAIETFNLWLPCCPSSHSVRNFTQRKTNTSKQSSFRLIIPVNTSCTLGCRRRHRHRRRRRRPQPATVWGPLVYLFVTLRHHSHHLPCLSLMNGCASVTCLLPCLCQCDVGLTRGGGKRRCACGGGDIETDEGSNMCCREASPLGLLHPRSLDPRQPFILIWW